ncbi:MAG TPA: hypothetical protein VJ650_09320 [Gemmatimonadaceae bacterium]|nr:hypothetical protein [Gemmatimonadaceae bacterium]
MERERALQRYLAIIEKVSPHRRGIPDPEYPVDVIVHCRTQRQPAGLQRGKHTNRV